MSEFQRILEDIDDYKNDIKECQEEITKTVKFLSEETDYLLLDDYLSPLTKLHTKLVQLKRDLMHSIGCLKKLEEKTPISEEQFKKDNGIIGTYTIDSKGLCNVEGNVDLSYSQLKEIPIAFGNVSGNFDCAGNSLNTLKNAPKVVGGYFICHGNDLTTLKNAPNYVGGYFDCDSNCLKTLKGAPKEVGGDFWCAYNPTYFTKKEVRAVCVVGGKIAEIFPRNYFG